MGFFSTLRRAPFHFFLLQLPEITADLLQMALEPLLKERLWAQLAVLVPYAILVSTLSAGLTFLAVRALHQGETPSLKRNFATLWSHASRLFPASFVAGILFILGMTLILPTLYFMALYLFVPQIVLSSEPLPLSVYLSRSKRLALSRFKTCLAIALGIILVSLSYLYFGEAMESRGGWLMCTYFFLSMVSGAIINVGVSRFYLGLTQPTSGASRAAAQNPIGVA